MTFWAIGWCIGWVLAGFSQYIFVSCRLDPVASSHPVLNIWI